MARNLAATVRPRFLFDQAELEGLAYDVTDGRTDVRIGTIDQDERACGWLAFTDGGEAKSHPTMRAAAEWLLTQHTKATANV